MGDREFSWGDLPGVRVVARREPSAVRVMYRLSVRSAGEVTGAVFDEAVRRARAAVGEGRVRGPVLRPLIFGGGAVR